MENSSQQNRKKQRWNGQNYPIRQNQLKKNIIQVD